MIGVVPKIAFALKKNLTSVSTGEVLGCANNWRSLDSRGQNLQKLCQYELQISPRLARNNPPKKQVVNLPIHYQS